MNPILYAALCVIVPVSWGVMVVWASNRVEAIVARRRARAGAARKSLTPTEYHI